MKIYGLTGGIASGKSTVAKLFTKLGAPSLDADELAHRLLEKNPDVKKRFSTNDRAKIRELVFEDPSARKELEAILHPLIASESKKELARLKGQFAIYEAALLIEAGRSKDFDGLIVVTAPVEARVKRCLARGLSEKRVRSIIAAQLSDEDRLKSADFVIQNDSSPDALKSQVELLYKRLTSP